MSDIHQRTVPEVVSISDPVQPNSLRPGSQSKQHLRVSKRRTIPLILLLVLSLVFIDMSSARLHYHYWIQRDVTPLKNGIVGTPRILHASIPRALEDCRAYDSNASAYVTDCALAACESNALFLSEKRQASLEHVRRWHPLIGIWSKLFDNYRGVDQSVKIEALFKRKSCEGIIQSSDKTNQVVDILALIVLPIGIMTLTWVISSFIRKFHLIRI
jgi:hypothetical protein